MNPPLQDSHHYIVRRDLWLCTDVIKTCAYLYDVKTTNFLLYQSSACVTNVYSQYNTLGCCQHFSSKYHKAI